MSGTGEQGQMLEHEKFLSIPSLRKELNSIPAAKDEECVRLIIAQHLSHFSLFFLKTGTSWEGGWESFWKLPTPPPAVLPFYLGGQGFMRLSRWL